MGDYITVSTKVRRELKEEAEKLSIRISEVLGRALEEEVRKRKLQELEKGLVKLARLSIKSISIEWRRAFGKIEKADNSECRGNSFSTVLGNLCFEAQKSKSALR